MKHKPTRANKIKALHDIWVFADLIDFHGGASKFGEVHRQMAQHLTAPQVYVQKNRPMLGTPDEEKFWDGYEALVQRLTLIPRGHLKSTMTVLYLLWRVYRNPNIRILLGTNIDRLNQRFIKELRAYFEDEELQHTVWNARPHIAGPLIPVLSAAGKRRTKNKDKSEEDTEAIDKKVLWNAENLELIRSNSKLKEPTFAGTTVGSVMTGDHYDIALLDDIVDFKNSNSQTKRDNISDWVGDLKSVIDPRFTMYEYGDRFSKVYDVVGGEFIYNGTRYFEDDEYDTLLNHKDLLQINVFFRNVYANGKDDSDGYLWPEGFGAREYNRIRREMQVKGMMRRFFAQYHNIIVADEEATLKYDLIKWIDNTRFKSVRPGYATVLPSAVEEAEGKLPIDIQLFLAVDPAKEAHAKADYSAITLGGYDHVGNFYIVESRYGRWKPSELLKNLFAITERWGVHVVTLDQNGVGAYLPQVINEYARKKHHRLVSIIKYKSGNTKKEERITRFLQPLLAEEALYAKQSVSNNEELRNEMALFPGANNHDDVLDSIAMVADVSFRTMQTKKKTGRGRSARRYKNSRVRPRNQMYGGTR